MRVCLPWLHLSIVLLLPRALDAQSLPPFPTDPELFPKELSKVMKATGREDCKVHGEDFEKDFVALSPDQQTAVIEMSNKMVAMALRAYPHFDTYILAIHAEVAAPGKFKQWHETLGQLLDNMRKGDYNKYEHYMDCIVPMLESRTLFMSKSKAWQLSSEVYEVKYEGGKPLIHVRSTDLIGTTAGDTATIYNTSGHYDIYETMWHGSGGRHTWESVGLPASDVYCDLPDYTIDFSKHQYQLDSVLFVFKPYFSEASLGVLTNQLQQTKTESTAYPQYVSYKNSVKIKNLMEGVDFEGVFKLEGSTIKGSSEGATKARFKFHSKTGKLLATARASSFKIDTREKAVSLEASLAIYFAEDSVFHPGLNFKFDVNKRELVATRGESGISDSRFYDSYHKMELDIDKVVWNLDEQKITMTNPGRGGQDPAYFESANLFDRKLYNEYLGVTSYAPLVVIKRYCDLWKTREIGAETLAREMQSTLTVQQIRPLLFNLMSDGFIIYDQDRELVIVQDKVFNYVDAFIEKVDYDIIQLKSVSTEENALIDLETLDMTLKGIERATLSQKQFVDIYPTGNALTVKKNRDMVFNGVVLGGRLDFYGRGYYFNYDSFFINMVELDSVMINLPSDRKDEFGQPILIPMNGILEDLSGTLFIDAPVNKSGNGDFPGYSRFVNRNPSYVYYDKYGKYKKKYPREDFYFKVNPFTIDSLEDFNINNQAFPGQFHSGGIFPTLEQDLGIRPDKSFGFVTETPSAGLPLYQGKGTYFETIDLSNQGLLGQGRIEYLTTKLTADDIIFFPDSMAANAQDMVMEERLVSGVEFPSVTNQNVGVTWLPYKDNMLLTMKETPFNFFNGYATLNGNVTVTPDGAGADGILDWKEAALTSDDFSFGSFTAKADTSSLKIKSLSPDKIAFNLVNVQSDVDFEERMGTFITNSPGVATDLPYNRFKTTMGKFDWDFDLKTIDLSPPPGNEYAVFTSTHPRQDSLSFAAKHGLFNMETSLLTAFEVPRIAVADAWVIPFEGKVTIGEDAVMQKLVHSEIIVDTNTKHHRFYEAEVEIFGKKSYKAVADYDYVNRSEIPQTLHFQEIGVVQHGDTANTYGVATIAESDSFRLDPKIRFQGQVKLEAGDEYMTFRGVGKMDVPVFPYYGYSYRIDSFSVHQSLVDSFKRNPLYAGHKVVLPRPTDTAAILAGMVKLVRVDSTVVFVNPNITHDWFRVDDEINPRDIQITVTNATNARNEPAFTGIHVRADTALMYATLLGNKQSGRDVTVFNVDGMVSYDDKTDRYIAAPKDKLAGKTVVGTQLIYHNQNGTVLAEGATDLGLKLQMVKLKASGNISKTTADSTYTFDVVIGFGFFAAKAVWAQMASDMDNWTLDKPGIDVEGDKVKKFLSMMMPDQDAADKMFNNYNMTGKINIPGETEYTLVLSATILWDPNEHTYRSVGPIGVIAVGDKQIARSVKGYLELGMARSSDYVNIYLEPDREEWYFITYRKNELGLFSASEAFNNVVKAVPDNNRLYKGEKPEDFMIFEIGSRAIMVRFVKNMQYFESLIRK